MRIKLVRVMPRVARVLEVTRLSQVFEAFASDEDAMRAFERAPAHGTAHLFTSTTGR